MRDELNACGISKQVNLRKQPTASCYALEIINKKTC